MGEVRPLILLSNDDGVTAPGLHALREALAVHGDVVVAAPESNQSATSHSLSLHRILRVRQVKDTEGGSGHEGVSAASSRSTAPRRTASTSPSTRVRASFHGAPIWWSRG